MNGYVHGLIFRILPISLSFESHLVPPTRSPSLPIERHVIVCPSNAYSSPLYTLKSPKANKRTAAACLCCSSPLCTRTEVGLSVVRVLLCSQRAVLLAGSQHLYFSTSSPASTTSTTSTTDACRWLAWCLLLSWDGQHSKHAVCTHIWGGHWPMCRPTVGGHGM